MDSRNRVTGIHFEVDDSQGLSEKGHRDMPNCARELGEGQREARRAKLERVLSLHSNVTASHQARSFVSARAFGAMRTS